jgi:hypothetical protein
MYNQEENCGCGQCYGQNMEWSKENKIAMLEKKEKMLEAKLEFIKKIKENMKKEADKEKKA